MPGSIASQTDVRGAYHGSGEAAYGSRSGPPQEVGTSVDTEDPRID